MGEAVPVSPPARKYCVFTSFSARGPFRERQEWATSYTQLTRGWPSSVMFSNVFYFDCILIIVKCLSRAPLGSV